METCVKAASRGTQEGGWLLFYVPQLSGKSFLLSKSLGILELCQILVAKVLVPHLTRCKKDGDDIEEWGKTLLSIRKSFLVMVLFKN